MSEAETEMIADFPNHKVCFKLERCDCPEKIKQFNDERCVFSRLELEWRARPASGAKAPCGADRYRPAVACSE